MFKSMMVCAMGAGLLTGVVAAALQFWLVVPVIGAAELYETGALTHFGAAGEAQVAEAHAHAAEGGLIRHAGTLVFTVATYLGFALFLVAGFALAERAGVGRITARAGVLWGMAGFAATQLFPALGLPPELPGSSAAALSDRQIWWLLTVALTVAGLALIAGTGHPLRWAGALLIAAPHILAAPHPSAYAGVAPPEMAALFAARVLGVGAVAWVVLGATAGWLWRDRAQPG